MIRRDKWFVDLMSGEIAHRDDGYELPSLVTGTLNGIHSGIASEVGVELVIYSSSSFSILSSSSSL